MSNATTFVTCLGSCVWTVLEDVSNLVAVVADWLVSILCTVPAIINVRREEKLNLKAGHLAMCPVPKHR